MENVGKSKSEYIYHSDDSAMSGYLYKQTRDNRWQKRWFETNGVYLTYYKSRKMEKLLAALSLPQVGEIKIVPSDSDAAGHQSGLFTLELNTRVYMLRAKSDQEAQLWVNTLNKLRSDGLVAQRKVEEERHADAVGGTRQGSRTAESKGNDASSTEWIKSGRSCCPCC